MAGLSVRQSSDLIKSALRLPAEPAALKSRRDLWMWEKRARGWARVHIERERGNLVARAKVRCFLATATRVAAAQDLYANPIDCVFGTLGEFDSVISVPLVCPPFIATVHYW